MEIDERFDLVEDDFRKFDRIDNKRSTRPDLHAFLLIDELFPRPGSDIVNGASHDQFWLCVEGDDMEKLTDDNILELTRCGVMYDVECDSLSMFA